MDILDQATKENLAKMIKRCGDVFDCGWELKGCPLGCKKQMQQLIDVIKDVEAAKFKEQENLNRIAALEAKVQELELKIKKG